MKKLAVFVPLLALYLGVILLTHPSGFVRDERRYVMYAKNLLHGQYAPKGTAYLWNGPGYPLVLAPVAFAGIPWIAGRLLNGFFLFFSVVYFYKTLCMYIKTRKACMWGYVFGLYLPFFRNLPYLLTETCALFLVTGLIYHISRFSRRNRTSQFVLASLFAGGLALTKIFFGYVLLCSLFAYAALAIVCRKKVFLYYAGIYLSALVICLPYLGYTYLLTGKVFYWGTSGGSSLYWMSSPYADELGDWHSSNKLDTNPQLEKHHRDFFESIRPLSWVKKDEILKDTALRTIRQHPVKFIKNWIANIGRLLFNYPYSYTPQKIDTLFYIVPNMFLIALVLFSIYPAWVNRTHIPVELYHYMGFGVISFFGSSLLSAYIRQFIVLIPFFLIGSVIVVQKYVTIKKEAA